jgi:drug/metabolite transporter (DMT)-like permease
MTFNGATLWAVFVTLIASVAQIMLKAGIAAATQGKPLNPADIADLARVVLTPMVFAGLALYGVAAIVWIAILAKLPLSTAYPILGLTFVFVPILSALLLREPVSAAQLGGAALIVIGVALVNGRLFS